MQDTPPAVTQNLELKYSITYPSREISVSGYHKLFEDQVIANFEDFAAIVYNNNLLVQEAQKALWEILSPSAAPSTSPVHMPSTMPSVSPTCCLKVDKYQFPNTLYRPKDELTLDITQRVISKGGDIELDQNVWRRN